MLKRARLISLICLFFSAVPLSEAASQSNAAQIFSNLDNYFVKAYGQNNQAIAQTTRPVLIVNNFDYLLLTSNGTQQKYSGLKSPFNELKAVSHIGPNLFSIAWRSWRNTADESWKKNLTVYQRLIGQTLKQIDNIDWSNSAWPGQSEQLKSFMRQSLQMVYDFDQAMLKKQSFTRKDYQQFAGNYLHTMVATMYLADVANTTAALQQLQSWKKQLGPEWDDLHVVVMGSKGRPISGLTLQTNTAALTVASLMNADKIESHLIIAPIADSTGSALQAMAATINARELAQATFLTEQAKQVSGLYEALKESTECLAIQNVKSIILQSLREGKVKLPEMRVEVKDN